MLALLRPEVVGVTLTSTLEKNQGSESFCNSFRVTQLCLEDQDPCRLALEPMRGTPVPCGLPNRCGAHVPIGWGWAHEAGPGPRCLAAGLGA